MMRKAHPDVRPAWMAPVRRCRNGVDASYSRHTCSSQGSSETQGWWKGGDGCYLTEDRSSNTNIATPRPPLVAPRTIDM